MQRPQSSGLGGTADQFAAWYGEPNDSPILDKNFPLLDGAIHHTYTYEGWRIRAAFVPPDGRAVRMEYSKIITAGVNALIQDYELQAIVTANTPPGATWKQTMYNNPASPNEGLGKNCRRLFCGSTWSEDVATKRRCDPMAAQQTLCPP